MPSLSAYSLIGNSRSAALVSKHGSIDWCCLPEFHSPAIFSALLDKNKGGYFRLCPVENYSSFQRYIADTNVVETVFATTGGVVVLTDCFVALTETEKAYSLFPDHEILRIVHCSRGAVPMKMEFEPTRYYGRSAATLLDAKKLGIQFFYKENTFFLQSTLREEEVAVIKNKAAVNFRLTAGEKVIFSFSCSCQSPAILPELYKTGLHRLEQTKSFWRTWLQPCSYEGVYKEQVRRSALVLKLLAHAPSGAIIAAPTTSLPEEIGGERNWDYRYCWLRDASFTVRALAKLGFEDEVHAYMNWILHATQLTRPELQVVYSVYGQQQLPEQALSWLKGFENSRPVRIGNGADNQFQLDVYGEVLDAYFSYASLVDGFDKTTHKFMLGLGEVICQRWQEPDNGIWEIRSAPAHHTHSKVMAWVGLDRLEKLCRRYQWRDGSPDKYAKYKVAIRQLVEQKGFSQRLHAYTRTFNEDSLDASSLVFSLVGYCEAASERMCSTVKCIRGSLSEKGFLYRYRKNNDGLKGEEGYFGICNFWLVENLARSGKLTDAVRLFENIVSHTSPTGLLAEEIHPKTFEPLGNYPQGFSHIGLINAALSINETIENEGV
ncbi:glycoside hydrolase family 15 protein [Flavisolibacter sp. BT320]|nr:glycoside hydrolase family 15 protein [Flavisolibacter longurius]